MAILVALERVFRFSGRDLPDPNPNMLPSEVMDHYVSDFPQLLGGKVVPPVQEGDRLIYEFRSNFGDKG